MNIFTKNIDFSKVRKIIYHMPDGKSYTISVSGLGQFAEFGLGRICDTSDVDGVVHFYPKGNA